MGRPHQRVNVRRPAWSYQKEEELELNMTRSARHCHWSTLLLSLLCAVLGCGGGAAGTAPADPVPVVSDSLKIPLTDMGSRRYLGFAGGLYPGGNDVPPSHLAQGLARARAIRPLDVNGNPSANGKYVLLSIGMSNTTQEFCSTGSNAPCASWSFMGQASVDPAVNHTTLAFVNGARGGQAAPSWLSPASAEYDRIRDTWLAPNGLSEKQVQVAWVKLANAQPTVSLPASTSDAYTFESQLGTVARTLEQRYPNLQQVFFSSRIYAGYATSTLNPEPYAYENGFSVKWLVQAQIDQAARGSIVDARAGDLNYASTPWLAWGPYLWAAGMTPRSDGLVWTIDDVDASDRTHPSQSGEQKVARLLLDFFKASPATQCWFVAGRTC
jgi:hypothetical protein